MTAAPDPAQSRVSSLTVLVIAKEPVPGRVKTRLCPPLTLQQAAEVASACLTDTLEQVARAPVARRILVLEGAPGPWLPPGFDIVPQGSGGLAQRLSACFALVSGPALVIGMDTPQVRPVDLWPTVDLADEPDGAFGAAADGGFWALGMRRPDPDVFVDVPMSVPTTGVEQLRRLRAIVGDVRDLGVLQDIDTIDDAHTVAARWPHLHLTAQVNQWRGAAAAAH